MAIALAAAACGSTDTSSSSVEATCPVEPDVSATAPPHASRADVEIILGQSCAVGGCHASAPGAGGLVLSMASAAWVDGVVAVPSRENPSMSLVNAGAPEESWLVHKVAGAPCGYTCDPKRGCGAQMPPGGGLSTTERATIVAWIKSGAPRD